MLQPESERPTAPWIQRRALIPFGLASLHAALLRPYIVLVAGERTNLFTAFLCAVALGYAIVDGWHSRAQARAGQRAHPLEIAVSVVLGLLIGFSGLSCTTPQSSSLRGFAVAASGLGGFWCARLVVRTPARRSGLIWCALGTLGVLLVTSLASYCLTGGYHSFTDANQHPLFARILLLSFAPIALLTRAESSRCTRVAAGLLLGLTCLVLCLSELRSAVVMPLFLGVLAWLSGTARRRLVAGLGLCTVVAIATFLHLFPHKTFRFTGNYEPAYYRIENYPFSYHVAVRNPWLGNGLRAPRTGYLTGYTLRYPHATREGFAGSVKRMAVSENIFLTFMADLGFPFTILYALSLLALFRRLIGSVRAPPAGVAIPPISLFLPLSGALAHLLIFDGLLHPQVSWFFHLLLGLVEPVRRGDP